MAYGLWPMAYGLWHMACCEWYGNAHGVAQQMRLAMHNDIAYGERATP